MRRGFNSLALGVALAFFVSSCGAVLIIPFALVAAIGEAIKVLERQVTQSKDVQEELAKVKNLLDKYKKPDGSYVIPKDDGEEISKEVDKLKDKSDALEKGIEKIKEILEKGLEEAKKKAKVEEQPK